MTSLQIKYFLAVADHLSFTKAAEMLYVAQPAVTKQIMALERELEMKLFNRHTRSVELTEAGILMRQAFLEMAPIFAAAQAAAQKAAMGESMTFTLGVLDGMYLPAITDALDALRRRTPQLTIYVWSGQSDFLKEKLLHDQIDLALTFDNQLQDISFLTMRSIFTSEYSILIPRGHPLANRAELTRADIAAEPFVLYIDGAQRGNSYGHLGPICQHLGIDAAKVVIPPTFSSIFSMVENGTGLALIDKCSNIPNRENFVIRETGFFHSFVAAWKQNSKNRLIDQFLALLEQYCTG